MSAVLAPGSLLRLEAGYLNTSGASFEGSKQLAKGTIPQAISAGHVIRNLGAIEQWIIGSAEILHGLSAPKSSRTAIPGAMFVPGVQYPHSIATFCRDGLSAGIFALLGPLVEAMFRGACHRPIRPELGALRAPYAVC